MANFPQSKYEILATREPVNMDSSSLSAAAMLNQTKPIEGNGEVFQDLEAAILRIDEIEESFDFNTEEYNYFFHVINDYLGETAFFYEVPNQ